MTTKTTYCLLITSRGHWRRIQEIGSWAFAGTLKEKVQSFLKSDCKCVVYLTADGGRHKSVVCAVIQLLGHPNHLPHNEHLSAFDKFYPIRVPFKIETIPSEPVSFKPLVPHLSFIRLKKIWCHNASD